MNRRTTKADAAALLLLSSASLLAGCLNPRPEEVPQNETQQVETPGFIDVDPSSGPRAPGGGAATPPAPSVPNEGASPVDDGQDDLGDLDASSDAGAPDAGPDPSPAGDESDTEAETTEDGE